MAAFLQKSVPGHGSVTEVNPAGASVPVRSEECWVSPASVTEGEARLKTDSERERRRSGQQQGRGTTNLQRRSKRPSASITGHVARGAQGSLEQNGRTESYPGHSESGEAVTGRMEQSTGE